MRTLSLLRHAKSSWDDPTAPDHERPLNSRGKRDAPRMGRFMREEGLIPDLVLCSDAVRTQETLRLIMAEWGEDAPKAVFHAALYLAEAPGIIKVLGKVGPDVQHCLVIGHNPGMHALALALADTGEPQALSDLSARFPTAALAVFDLKTESWSKVRPATGRLRLFVTPKEL